MLKDAVSQTRGAINYLVILTLVITPFGIFVFQVLQSVVMPKFLETGLSDGREHGRPVLHQPAPACCDLSPDSGFGGTLDGGGSLYRRADNGIELPFLQRLHYQLPWRRKRMERDFLHGRDPSRLGRTQADAVMLAAGCTTNLVFRHRASRAVDALKQGLTMRQATKMMDDSGEIGWRLTNASHGSADS